MGKIIRTSGCARKLEIPSGKFPVPATRNFQLAKQLEAS